MDLNEYEEVQRHKVCLYGPPKSGKTAAAGELAGEGFKLWWFDFENGVKTLRNPEILKPEFRKNVSLFNIPDHRAYPIAIQTLRELFKGGNKKFCFTHGKNQCSLCAKNPDAKWSEEINLANFTDKDILVVDSWTQVSLSAGNQVTLKAWEKDNEYKMTFDDYRAQGMWQDEILSKFQVSNLNILVLNHEVDVEKSESKEKIVPQAGTRNFSKTFAKYFDEIIFMQVLNKKHSIYSATTWDNAHLTGGRSGIKLEEGGGLSLKDIFLGNHATEKIASVKATK